MPDSNNTSKRTFKADFLLSPWAILIGMAFGIYIGAFYKNTDVLPIMSGIGDTYLSLLQMCILPVLLSAVASSLGSLIRSKNSKKCIKMMVVTLAGALLLASMLGILGGMWGRPGSSLDSNTKTMMGKLLEKSETSLDLEMNFFGENPPENQEASLVNFFKKIVTPNIFDSLSKSHNLQVLFFAIIVGLAAGTIRKDAADSLLSVLEAVYLTFSQIIRWAMYLLPFGICCLVAKQLAEMGLDILMSMAKFIILFYACCIIFFIINTIIIWRKSGQPLFKVLSKLEKPIFIALGTRSSLATIPSAISAMADNLKFNATNTKLILPLGITIGRFGNVLYFALGAIFVSQLYNTELCWQCYLLIAVGSILAGMATSGSTGVLTLAMMCIVLEPLQLPLEAVLVLFIAIDPIVDPMRSLTIVYPSCAITALVAGKEEGEENKPKPSEDKSTGTTEILSQTAASITGV
jgi:proton glutamate symport protein